MPLTEAVDFVLISVVMLTEPGRPCRVGALTDLGLQHGWRGTALELDQAIKFLERAQPAYLEVARRDSRWPSAGEADLTLTKDGRLAAEERLRALLDQPEPVKPRPYSAA